jgi:hypothetical protein
MSTRSRSGQGRCSRGSWPRPREPEGSGRGSRPKRGIGAPIPEGRSFGDWQSARWVHTAPRPQGATVQPSAHAPGRAPAAQPLGRGISMWTVIGPVQGADAALSNGTLDLSLASCPPNTRQTRTCCQPTVLAVLHLQARALLKPPSLTGSAAKSAVQIARSSRGSSSNL